MVCDLLCTGSTFYICNQRYPFHHLIHVVDEPMIFKAIVRVLYRVLRLLFYPIVILLSPIVPVQSFTVGSLTVSV